MAEFFRQVHSLFIQFLWRNSPPHTREWSERGMAEFFRQVHSLFIQFLWRNSPPHTREWSER
ncbi:MAG: hypothetical protein PUJ09_00230, partial [Eubacteriales bacterium]|nr:hypothetical protein [Eubacteriales bacterium]